MGIVNIFLVTLVVSLIAVDAEGISDPRRQLRSSSPEIPTQGECKDIWTTCHQNKPFCNNEDIKKNCKETCGVCGECKDIFTTCQQNKQYCTSEDIKKNCKETCGVCVNCKDIWTTCHHNKPYCNQEVIKKNCKETCGVCGRPNDPKYN